MSDAAQAFQDLLRLGRSFQGIMALVPQLEQAGSLEALNQATEKSITDGKARLEELAIEIRGRVQDVEQAKADAITTRESTRAEAADIIEQAKIQAKAATDQAQADRDRCVEEAHAEAARIIQEATDKVAGMSEAIAGAEARISELDRLTAEKQQAHDAIAAELAAIRTRIGA